MLVKCSGSGSNPESQSTSLSFPARWLVQGSEHCSDFGYNPKSQSTFLIFLFPASISPFVILIHASLSTAILKAITQKHALHYNINIIFESYCPSKFTIQILYNYCPNFFNIIFLYDINLIIPTHTCNHIQYLLLCNTLNI